MDPARPHLFYRHTGSTLEGRILPRKLTGSESDESYAQLFCSPEVSQLLASGLDIFRLTLHVLAAAIWVGGQFALAGMVPALRKAGPGVASAAAKAFARLSWPAYALLVITGLWNVSTFQMSKTSTAWKIVLGVKLTLVAIAGISAYLHQRAKSPRAIGIWGGVTALSSVAILAMGVALAG